MKRTFNNTISPQELMLRHVSSLPPSIQPASTKHSTQAQFSSWTRKRGYLSNKNSTKAALNFSNQNDEAIGHKSFEQHPNIRTIQLDIQDSIMNQFDKGIPKYNVTKKPAWRRSAFPKLKNQYRMKLPLGQQRQRDLTQWLQ